METQNTNQANHAKWAAKMAEVIKLSKNVEKKGTNKEQGYKFATHSDIIQELRQHIADQKLFILPKPESFESQEIVSRNGAKGALITMKMDFEIIDNETGYSVTIKWFGQGMDYGDKAIYKSYTGALKYFLLDTFMISTGDDPENDNPDRGNAAAAKQPASAYKPQPMQPGQRTKILELLPIKGKSTEDLDAYLQAAFKVSLDGLNTAQANAAIKKLESMPDVAKDDPTLDLDEIDKGIEAQRLEKTETPIEQPKDNGAVGTTTEPK